jgi:hypothetical protein
VLAGLFNTIPAGRDVESRLFTQSDIAGSAIAIGTGQ